LKITREIKTAILVIASILLFIWGYSFLKGKDLLKSYKTFYVEYDSVEGLSKSAPVTLNGLVIGKVEDITIDENTGKLLVELQINTDFPISKSSIASIYAPGFITGKQISIEPNFEDKILATDGQRLEGKVQLGLTESLGDKLLPLQDKIEKVLVHSDEMITSINNVLDKKSQQELKNSLAELSKTMEQFRKASTNVNIILEENKNQIKGVVSNFNKISGDFSEISDSLNKADLGESVKTLNMSLAKVNGILSGIESGKGTMGKMFKDDAFYNNLSSTSKQLELLLQDIRLYPTRYVNVSLFGKKNKPYKAPTEDAAAKVKN